MTILAAASTTDAITEAAREFERRQSDIRIMISTGPSNGLAKQILAGAPADLYLSAHPKWADAVAREGLAEETIDLLGNRLVLIVPRDNPASISGVMDLTPENVTRVALAGENVPAGIYAMQALSDYDLLKPLQQANRIAYGSDVRVAMAYVEQGEVEAGIVYATDASLTERVEVVEVLSPDTYPPIRYPLVLLKSAADNRGAEKFFKFLRSQEGLQIFRKYGFTRATTNP